MLYSLFDTTSLWIIANWLAPNSPTWMRPGPRLLANFVIAVICCNHATVLQNFPGSGGFLLGLTSYKFLQLRKDAAAGGLTGVGRHALLAVLRQLGVLREDHHQYDFLQAMAFFAEHCMLEADSAWCELQQRPGPEHTLQVLQRLFFLPLLCAVQVGRYLELTDSRLFSGRACDALGPRALEMASYVFPSEKHPAQQDCPFVACLRAQPNDARQCQSAGQGSAVARGRRCHFRFGLQLPVCWATFLEPRISGGAHAVRTSQAAFRSKPWP